MDVIMMAEFERKGKQKVDVRFENTSIPCIIEENFEPYYSENSVNSIEDVLQDQEIVYQSLQGVRDNDMAKASSSNYPKHYPEPGEGSRSSTVRNPSNSMSFKSQLSLDEALARELQYQEDNLAATSLFGTERSAETSVRLGNDVKITADISTLATEQADIVRENMTYEELQSLGEAIGTESRGLPDDLISYLPSFTYKTGFFSRKDKDDKCVICVDCYKNRQTLIALPCKHQYHAACIRNWLKINKICPVCKEEVFGP